MRKAFRLISYVDLVAECVKHFGRIAAAPESLDGFRYPTIDKPSSISSNLVAECVKAFRECGPESLDGFRYPIINKPLENLDGFRYRIIDKPTYLDRGRLVRLRHWATFKLNQSNLNVNMPAG